MGIFKLIAGASCQLSGGSFFGLPTWYKYLADKGEVDPLGRCRYVPKVENMGDGLLVLLGLVDILLRVGGMVAFGFIVWGGLQMVLSQGEPDKRAKAVTTLINAAIGLVITLSAAGILSFVAGKF